MSKKLMLIHGAWQGQWAWKPIIEKLENEQLEVVTLDLPGSGEDDTELSDVTLEAYAKAIVETAQNFSDKGDIVLVGHSMGGAAVTAAASLMPNLFRKVIYLCAFLPSDGQSVAQLGAESQQLGTTGPIGNVNEEGTQMTLDPTRIVDTFFNDCEGSNVVELAINFRPQALKPITTPVTTKPEFRQLEKAYIVIVY
jgi:pimeloyl-ACP methyl ester carboxylesterase